jgi:HPt (histidine-containing phosphotransfer) domain-containing protein
MNFNYISLDYMTLMANDDLELKKTMLEMLIEDLATQVPKLNAAILQTDWPSMKSIGHYLKSSFVFVGNEELSIAIKTIDHHATSRTSMPIIKQQMAKITQLLPFVKKELNSALTQLK